MKKFNEFINENLNESNFKRFEYYQDFDKENKKVFDDIEKNLKSRYNFSPVKSPDKFKFEFIKDGYFDRKMDWPSDKENGDPMQWMLQLRFRGPENCKLTVFYKYNDENDWKEWDSYFIEYFGDDVAYLHQEIFITLKDLDVPKK